MNPTLTISRELIREFCRSNRIRKLSIFGSALRDDFTPESDVDVLIEFEPGVRVGLKYIDLEQQLSNLMHRRIDLNTPGFISRYFRDQVMAQAEVLYEQS